MNILKRSVELKLREAANDRRKAAGNPAFDVPRSSKGGSTNPVVWDLKVHVGLGISCLCAVRGAMIPLAFVPKFSPMIVTSATCCGARARNHEKTVAGSNHTFPGFYIVRIT